MTKQKCLINFFFLIFFLLVSKPGYCYQGDEVVYKGNKFTIGSISVDTIYIQDSITHKAVKKCMRLDRPLKMNGKKIFNDDDPVTEPDFNKGFTSFNAYLWNALKPDLEKLADGS